MQAHTILCHKCGYRSHPRSPSGQRRYRLPDGLEYEVNCTLAWCHDCNGPQLVEVLPITPSQRIWEDGTPWWRKARFRLRALLAELPSFARIIPRHAIPRHSLPRCLICDGTHHEPISLQADDTAPNRHPGCGGELDVEWEDVWFNYGYQIHYHDTEGNFLQTERPTPPWKRQRESR
jgi:hypothetical protein